MLKKPNTILIKEQLVGSNNRMRKIQLASAKMTVGSTPEADIELKAFEKDFLFELYQTDGNIFVRPLSAECEIRLNGRILSGETAITPESILIFDAHQLQMDEPEAIKPAQKKIDPLHLRFDSDKDLIVHLLQSSPFSEILILKNERLRIKTKGQWVTSSWTFKKYQFAKSFLEKALAEAPSELQSWDVEFSNPKVFSDEFVLLRKASIYDERIKEQDFQSLSSLYAEKSSRFLIRGVSESNLRRIDQVLHKSLKTEDVLFVRSSRSMAKGSPLVQRAINSDVSIGEIPLIEFPARIIFEIDQYTSAEELKSLLSRQFQSIIVLDPERVTDRMGLEDLPEIDIQIELENLSLVRSSSPSETYNLLVNKS